MKMTKSQKREVSIFADRIGRVPLDVLEQFSGDDENDMQDLADKCTDFVNDAGEILERIARRHPSQFKKGWFV